MTSDRLILIYKDQHGTYLGALVVDETLTPAPLEDWTIEEVIVEC